MLQKRSKPEQAVDVVDTFVMEKEKVELKWEIRNYAGVRRQVLSILDIKQARYTVYHPQSGFIEHYTTTLRCYCNTHDKDWDEGIPCLIFSCGRKSYVVRIYAISVSFRTRNKGTSELN